MNETTRDRVEQFTRRLAELRDQTCRLAEMPFATLDDARVARQLAGELKLKTLDAPDGESGKT